MIVSDRDSANVFQRYWPLINYALIGAIICLLSATSYAQPIATKTLCDGAPGQSSPILACGPGDPHFIDPVNNVTPIVTPVYYAVSLDNSAFGSASTVTFVETLPAHFSLSSVDCVTPSGGAVSHTVTSGQTPQVTVDVPAAGQVVCLFEGSFDQDGEGAAAINTVSGDVSAQTDHEIGDQPSPLAGDLEISKSVLWMGGSGLTGPINIASGPGQARFRITVTAKNPVTLTDLFRVHDEVSGLPDSVPLLVDLVPGSTSCDVLDTNGSAVSSGCLTETVNASPAQPWGGGPEQPLVTWGVPSGQSISLQQGWSIELEFTVEIASDPAFMCEYAPNSDGVTNQAFLGLAGYSGVIEDTDSSNNTSGDVAVPVTTGATSPCPPGGGGGVVPPPQILEIEKLRHIPSTWPQYGKNILQRVAACINTWFRYLLNSVLGWNDNQPSAQTSDTTYFIRITNTSDDALARDIMLTDAVRSGPSTPPFTVQMMRQDWLWCPPSDYFQGGPTQCWALDPAPAPGTTPMPGLSRASAGSGSPLAPPDPTAINGYGDHATVWRGGLRELKPGQSAVLRIDVNYSDPWCDASDGQLPKEIENIFAASYTGEGVDDAGDPMTWQGFARGSRTDEIDAPESCDFVVTKTVIGENRLRFDEPLTYEVTYTNDMDTEQYVGTVLDSLRIMTPGYANGLAMEYQYTCVEDGVANAPTTNTPTSGSAPYTASTLWSASLPQQGTRLYDVAPGQYAIFQPGATLSCTVEIIVQRPPLSADDCLSSVEPQIQNTGVMDTSMFYNASLGWPPTEPSDETSWDTVETPAPRCYDLSLTKTPDQSAVGPNGGPVSFTVTLENDGDDLDLAAFDFGGEDYGVLLTDDIRPPYDDDTDHPRTIITDPCAASGVDCDYVTPADPSDEYELRFYDLPSGLTDFQVAVDGPYTPGQSVCNSAAASFEIPEDREGHWYPRRHLTHQDAMAAMELGEVCIPITGELLLEKDVAYSGEATSADLPAGGYDLSVSCTDASGANVIFTSGPHTVADGGSHLVAGMPFGALCTVSETPPAATNGCWWAPASYSSTQPVAITADPSPNRLGVTNTYHCPPTQDVLIAKQVLDPTNQIVDANGDLLDPSLEFDVTLACLPSTNWPQGGNWSGLNTTVTISPGSPATVPNVPVGALCTLSETVVPPADAGLTPNCYFDVSFHPGSGQFPLPDEGGTVDIRVVNEVRCDAHGSLQIRKDFILGSPEVPDAAWDLITADAQPVFDVDCAANSTPPHPYSPTLTLSGGQVPPVTHLSENYTCDVSEQPLIAPPGCAWTTAYPDGTSHAITAGATTMVRVENTLTCTPPETPDLEIEKEAINCGGPDSCTFEVTITNNGPGDFFGPLFFMDELTTGSITEFVPPDASAPIPCLDWTMEYLDWSACVQPSPNTAMQSGTATLVEGASITTSFTMEGLGSTDKIENCVSLFPHDPDAQNGEWINATGFTEQYWLLHQKAAALRSHGIVLADHEPATIDAAIEDFAQQNGLDADEPADAAALALALYGAIPPAGDFGPVIEEGDPATDNNMSCAGFQIEFEDPNLSIEKTKLTPGNCFDSGYDCSFQIEIFNHSSSDYTGPVTIADAADMSLDPQILVSQTNSTPPAVVVNGASPAGWTCSTTNTLPAIECEHPNLTIPASGSVVLTLDTTMTNGDVLAANCAELTEPHIPSLPVSQQGPVDDGPWSCTPIGLPLLDIEKVKITPGACHGWQPGANHCTFEITIQNTSTTQTYTGPLEFQDAVGMGLDPQVLSTPLSQTNGLIGFNAPAGWTCAETGQWPNIACDNPNVTLAPGQTETIELTLDLNAPAPLGANCAEITAPQVAGQSGVQTGPVAGGPVDCALIIEPTNLEIEKVQTSSGDCETGQIPGQCSFDIIIRNLANQDYHGPLTFVDAAGAVSGPNGLTQNLGSGANQIVSWSGPNGWSCIEGPNWPSIECTNPYGHIPPNGEVVISLTIADFHPFLGLPVAGNCAELTEPEVPGLDPADEGPVADGPFSCVPIAASQSEGQLDIGKNLQGGCLPNSQTDLECTYTITITNWGSQDFHGPVEFVDAASMVPGTVGTVLTNAQPSVATLHPNSAAPAPGWSCIDDGSAWPPITCSHPNLYIPAGDDVSIDITIISWVHLQLANNCVELTGPISVDQNGDPIGSGPINSGPTACDGVQLREMPADDRGPVGGDVVVGPIGVGQSQGGDGEAEPADTGGSTTPQGPQLEIAKTKLSTWRCHGPALPDHPDPNVCVFEISVTNTGERTYSGPVEVQDAAGEPGPGVFGRPAPGVSLVEGPAPQSGWTCADRGTGLIDCATREIRLEPGATSRFRVTQRFDTPAPLAANCAALTGPLAGAAPACAPLEAELPDDPSACAQADGRWDGQICSCPARHVFSQTWGRCTPLFCSPPMQLNEARSACVCPAGQALVNGQCRDTAPNIDRLIEIFAPVIGEGGGSESRPDPGPACNPNGPVPC
ncbi:MAG: DUF5979 domain-containing protein [Oceanicaulis sp.]